MFDAATVQTSYLSLIAWRESADTEMPKYEIFQNYYGISTISAARRVMVY